MTGRAWMTMNKLEVPIGSNYNNCMMSEIKMKYADILDIEWQLSRRKAEMQKQWDDYRQYGKGDILYDIALDELKAAEKAEKLIKNIWNTVKESNIKEVYSTTA